MTALFELNFVRSQSAPTPDRRPIDLLLGNRTRFRRFSCLSEGTFEIRESLGTARVLSIPQASDSH